VGLNCPGCAASIYAADIQLVDAIWLKWEEAALFSSNLGHCTYTIFTIFPHIHDTQLLQRALSMYHINWEVSETHAELNTMCTDTWDATPELFYSTVKTARCFAKAVIASRLPHLVEEAEVSAFLPTAEPQFRDLFFQEVGASTTLSLLGCLCAQHTGDEKAAVRYSKAELDINVNPFRHTQAHMALGVTQTKLLQQEED
jgi:hypothetical protein